MAIGHRAAARSVLECRSPPCDAERRWGSGGECARAEPTLRSGLGYYHALVRQRRRFRRGQEDADDQRRFRRRHAVSGDRCGGRPSGPRHTQIKRLRHLNFLPSTNASWEVSNAAGEVARRAGRSGDRALDWFGQLAGFARCCSRRRWCWPWPQQMTFAAVAKLVGCSWHRVHAICSRYGVDLALAEADLLGGDRSGDRRDVLPARS